MTIKYLKQCFHEVNCLNAVTTPHNESNAAFKSIYEVDCTFYYLDDGVHCLLYELSTASTITQQASQWVSDPVSVYIRGVTFSAIVRLVLLRRLAAATARARRTLVVVDITRLALAGWVYGHGLADINPLDITPWVRTPCQWQGRTKPQEITPAL